MEDEQVYTVDEDIIEGDEEVESDEFDPEEGAEEEGVSPSDAEASSEDKNEDDSENDEFFIDAGDPEPEERETNNSSFRQLRQASRDKDKRIKELEKALHERNQPEDDEVEIGPKPTLEDYDWDQDEFAAALLDWSAEKQEKEAKAKQKKDAERSQLEAWEQRVESYNDRKTKVKNSDFEQVERFVTDTLSTDQQALIIAASEDPVKDMYMLGKSPENLKRLSEINDQAQFVYQLGKLQTGGKMATKKSPPPEKRVKATAKRQTSDAKLKELEERAARTGDRTELIRYKSSLSK